MGYALCVAWQQGEVKLPDGFPSPPGLPSLQGSLRLSEDVSTLTCHVDGSEYLAKGAAGR